MNKFFALLFFLFAFVNSSKGAYIEFEPISLMQPDGSVINVFASGDEFYNWLHDKEGYTIVQNNKSGYYVYGTLSGTEIIPTSYVVGIINPIYTSLKPWITVPIDKILQKRNSFFAETPKDIGDAPKTGLINNLVVYIRFSDEIEFTDSSAYYNRLFNLATPNTNSMLNYFKEASYNALTIKTYFYPVSPTAFVISYKDSLPRSYYKPYDSISNPNGYTSSNKTSREHNLLRRAIDFVENQVPDTLNLDGDNDGKVDNVCFIVYGSSTAWADLLWPHRWSLYSLNSYINGKRVYDYNFQLQNSLKSSGVGVLCHEMFHSLGAPDLYHYTSNGISPCYRWDIMDANRNPPQHMCAHMKLKYGTWISSIPTISTPGIYTLKPLTSPTNNAYKILSPYSTIEYFVVEYRKKHTIFENSLPGDGMIIYRINSTKNGNANGPPDEVYAYRPGGTLTANGDPSWANFSSTVGRTSINRYTNPSPFMYDGIQGGLNIDNITASDSTISFTLGNPTNISGGSEIYAYKLEQNFPNPFNASTKIVWKNSKSENVTLKIYNILGKEISTPVNAVYEAGTHEILFNADKLSGGIYYYVLQSGNFKETKTMILLK